MLIQPPPGFRDFLPAEQELRRWMFSVIEKNFRRWGFLPLSTSSVEYLDVLTAKSGEAIKDEIFLIEGEPLGLRFELTASLARFIAKHQELPRPFKRYEIAKVWRNEEPQRARYREFIQADADIIGVENWTAEVDLLLMAVHTLNELGIKEFRILINDRRFLNKFAADYDIKGKEFFRIVDKFDKIGLEGVKKQLAEKGYDPALIEKLSSIAFEEYESYSPEAYEALANIRKYVDVKVTPYLVRGLDYYTGPIFEFKLPQDIGSIAAGGRYDDLIGLFGKPEPAVGISLGFERIYYMLRNNLPKPELDVFIAWIGDAFSSALELANRLRTAGLKVDINYGRSLKKQLEYADKRNARFVVIIGSKELREDKATLRNMISGEQKTLTLEEIYEVLVNHSR